MLRVTRVLRRRPRSVSAYRGLSSYACACEESCNKCDHLDADRRLVLHPYTSMTDPLPTFPVRQASGVWIELEDGRRMVDGMSSWWAAVHGYRHPEMDAAVKAQVDKMSHVMFGGLTHRPAVELCEKLVEMTPAGLNKVFLCDSGSVSVEVALKMAVQYWHTIGKPKKTRFVSLLNGYHGDTFGAMSVCDPVNGMHSMFSGLLAKQHFVESPQGPSEEAARICAEKVKGLLAEKSDEIAAVILEPVVQGAGGMRFHHPRLLRALREACDQHDVLLIFDEIATGFGRTGTLFACEQSELSFRPWYSGSERSEASVSSDSVSSDSGSDARSAVVPDILCLGKALTGGYMTLGATLCVDRVCQGISSSGGVFMHGPTFMGNPLACATAQASLNLLENSPWKSRVNAVHSSLVDALAPAAQLDSVRQVRVLGAIGVCELKEPVKNMAAAQRAFVDKGVWLRPFGKLLYTMPPFNCPGLQQEHVHRIGQVITEIASDIERMT